jgi:hypothetical protein
MDTYEHWLIFGDHASTQDTYEDYQRHLQKQEDANMNTDRFYAQCMFGGSHVRHNPGGLLWEVCDHDEDESSAHSAIVTGIPEEMAKRLALDLNAAEAISRARYQKRRSKTLRPDTRKVP